MLISLETNSGLVPLSSVRRWMIGLMSFPDKAALVDSFFVRRQSGGAPSCRFAAER
jgi:hypothetical protein